ncbi:MAG: hypothetical protein ACK2TU_08760, partial [Anaerolineales bacterium]
MLSKFTDLICCFTLFSTLTALSSGCENESALYRNKLAEDFRDPPRTAYPGVYWYFMDGNLS